MWTNHFVAPLIITMLMSAIVSCIATVRVAGFGGLGEHWLGACLLSWMVAYPALLVVMPIARWIVSQIVEDQKPQNK
jgi:Zn-dependent protease with chaperone function